MNGKIKYACHFIILFAVFCLQNSPLLHRFAVADVTPDVVFAFLFIYALYYKQTEVITYALVIGSFTDLLYGKIYGVTTLLLLGFVCLFSVLNKYIYRENLVTILGCGFLSTALYKAVWAFIDAAFKNGMESTAFAAQKALICCVYTTLCIIPVFAVCRRNSRKREEALRA